MDAWEVWLSHMKVSDPSTFQYIVAYSSLVFDPVFP